MKKALITGINGQDGSYLAEHLLESGYEVHGIVRRVALEDPKHRLMRVSHILDHLVLHAGTLESSSSLYQILQNVMPDECYHLAAESFVSDSFDDEFLTMNVNINGTHYLLSALKMICPECRFYFAASSEMFGNAEESPQNENTKLNPRSVYGISKTAGFHLTRNYREAYGLFACSGILYNHESPRRGFEFVTRKITSYAAKIKHGLEKEIRLGNIDAKRDWGFAGDYVKAIHTMICKGTPDDYVIATGKTHTVRDFLDLSFNILGLNYRDYLVIDRRFFRSTDTKVLVGNSSKAAECLGWNPKIDFEELVVMMIKADYDRFRA